MGPPNRRPHRFGDLSAIWPRPSFKILDVLAVSSEPAVKTGALALPHAHAGCHRPRTNFANAPKAWRRSPHMAAEPQPRSGALAVAAAGPAGSAVENPYATTAALSDAPGIATAIEATRRPNDPAAWGYAARSPTAGKIWRTAPPSRSRYVRRKAPFQPCRLSAIRFGAR
jgi:hypothetical protein